MVWKTYLIIVCIVSWLCCCKLWNVMKMVISSLFMLTCHLYCFKTCLWQVLSALRKNKKLKRMYQFMTYRALQWILYFKECIMRRNEFYISRDASRVAIVTAIEDRNACRDECMDRYFPYGSQTEQWVCIIRSYMHHYTWHCIPMHCTNSSSVNLILCFVDLVNAFLWNLSLMNTELVVEDI